MENILTPAEGIVFLTVYGAVMIAATLLVSHRRHQDTPEFLLAGRRVGVLFGAMSIAAAWIWAPALFVSSQKAYEQGLPGAFWFIFPNLLALLVFAPLGLRVRQVLPKGYTFPQYIRLRHGKGVHILYLIQFVGLQLCSFAVQILAGATLIHTVSGLPFSFVAAFLILIVLTYSLLGGLRASVTTDCIQMFLILLICAVSVPWVVSQAGGFSAVTAGFGGASGNFSSLFDPWVAYSFGISTTIGLLSGPIGDQMHWQRAYALKSDADVIKTFVLAAFLFVLVPLTLSTLGFVAAGKVNAAAEGWTIASAQMVGPTTVSYLLPSFMLIAFSVMILAGLCSTLDSILCAVSSITVADLFGAGHTPQEVDRDVYPKQVLLARTSMLVAALVGFGIAMIPNLKILHLFLFYGTLRASTLIPTVLTLYWPRLQSKAVFYAVMGSLIFGAPILALGTYLGNPHLSVTGSLLVIAIGLGVCVGLSITIKPVEVTGNVS
ncbi:MAG: sodium:solute symporter family transporter [Gammaproteobacteria bacterium]